MIAQSRLHRPENAKAEKQNGCLFRILKGVSGIRNGTCIRIVFGGAKLFASAYAIYSGLVFVGLMGIFLAPLPTGCCTGSTKMAAIRIGKSRAMNDLP
jgi:hypothetical protein